MLFIRIYISVLTLIFLGLVIANRGLGILEAVVITCAIVYLILDTRSEFELVKSEFRLLQQLEQRLSEFLR
jgi:Na+/H+ antiporter NhaC